MSHDDTLGRRHALKVLGFGAAGGLVVLAGKAMAQAPAAPAGAPLVCTTKAKIDDQSRTMRRTLQYVEKSKQAGKQCSSCSQYEDKKYGDCGACKLFTGAVNPAGFCLSYAPKA